MTLTRDEILNRKTGRREVELPGGGTVTIRGLTHAEVVKGNDLEDLNDRTCFMIATALVDPVMSYEDVQAWSENGDAGDLTTISEALQELSALGEGARKSRVSRSRRR